MGRILSAFDLEFTSLDTRLRALLARLPDEKIFTQPTPAAHSCGELLLRSAAIVEQTFGGITTRLWDDPFEWTLPEKLADRVNIVTYLDEVSDTRRRGLSFIGSDVELGREIPAPTKMRSLGEVLIECIAQASRNLGRAQAAFEIVTGDPLPRR